MERRLSAILAADVVGYSKLIGEDQAGTLAALRRLRAALFSPSVASHGGDTVKSMGDGWIVAFDAVVDAVKCAIEIQAGMAGHPKLQLRIGIHLGDIVHEEDDLFGDGVNVAARLEAAAAPGDILISDVVHHSLDGTLSDAFRALPPMKLKNIERPFPVFAWRDGPEDAVYAPESGPSGSVKSVTLGFEGMEVRGGDGDAQLLCDGVTDAIRAALANQPGMELRTNSREADMLVEGSLQAVGLRYRAVIRLVDQANGKLIGSERFDGRIEDLFEAEDELALRICTSLRFSAFNYEASTLTSAEAPDDGALRVRAGGLLSDLKYADWLEARQILDGVLGRDPEDASALAMAGMARLIDPTCGWQAPDAADCAQGVTFLKNAVKLNPDSDFGWTILVLAQLELARDFRGALITSEQVMRQAPHYAQGQMARAAALIANGEIEEGTELGSRAIEPLKSLRLFSQNAAYLMLGLLLSRRYDEVLEWGTQVSQRIEGVPRNLLLMISAAAHAGDTAAMTQRAEALLTDQPGFRLEDMWNWPLGHDEHIDHILSGLRLAGLPE